MVPVVQLVRASDCGSECRRFESVRAPKRNSCESTAYGNFCLINISTNEFHHFLLGFRRTELGGVQIGAVAAYGVDDQLDVGAYLLWHAGAPRVVAAEVGAVEQVGEVLWLRQECLMFHVPQTKTAARGPQSVIFVPSIRNLRPHELPGAHQKLFEL